MSTAYETLVRLMLPEGMLEYFELTNVIQAENGLNIYLEEKNIVPTGYEKSQLESKGFLPETAIQENPNIDNSNRERLTDFLCISPDS